MIQSSARGLQKINIFLKFIRYLMFFPVPEIIDPVSTKTSPKRSFCMTEYERLGLVFTKTGSINSGTDMGIFSYRPIYGIAPHA